MDFVKGGRDKQRFFLDILSLFRHFVGHLKKKTATLWKLYMC
jgi:hypothetical protein